MMGVVSAADSRNVTTRDGRTLRFAEWGQPEGFPVFSLHGAPGSRFARFFDEGVYADVGARVITYDRPGYGASDRHRGRQVGDCVADVAAIADHLAIEQFAVTGASVGRSALPGSRGRSAEPSHQGELRRWPRSLRHARLRLVRRDGPAQRPGD
jgi:pimeloyl-ACP methyl ester carboxylesterase